MPAVQEILHRLRGHALHLAAIFVTLDVRRGDQRGREARRVPGVTELGLVLRRRLLP
ncbi:hypothetical protein [Streptomyces sp. NPDC006879]|uniref:hypothetical protein n=1 Tax=Streptomyces sp. NPDC006879 TaxID=3364767 RepID=UPI00368290AE